MFKKKLMLLSLIVLILLIVPLSSAHENTTDSLGSNINASAVSNDIYFDRNATTDHGWGTADDPYRELRDGRILDDSVVHLRNGEYKYSQIASHNNVSFIGEDAEKTIIIGDGENFIVNDRLVLANLTICNLNIYNHGDLFATNTIFTNTSAVQSTSFADSFGGAIYCVDYYSNAYLTNCTFSNNYAKYGGAIYLNGGILKIDDCLFINNTAQCFGGAIAAVNKNSNFPKLSVKKSRFIKDTSLVNAGGAIYVKSGSFEASDLTVSLSNASFGGAFAILNAKSTLTNINAHDNFAAYDGGAIYQMYGNLTLKNSCFYNNTAVNGQSAYLTSLGPSAITNSTFTNASIYSLFCYSLNIDDKSSLISVNNLSLILDGDDYVLLNNIIEDSSIPSFYSSIDEGYVTPVKQQQTGGNCWAFAILATLESCIMKASGMELDLSEENMKNLASLYSTYGWLMDTNAGGYTEMGLGYLTSWLGPVLEDEDSYSSITSLSPVLESIMHVQNMLFLKRSNVNDLDNIKKAIMDYGAVYSGIFMMAHYDSQVNEYVQYYGGNFPCDHAVALVGWDDDFYIPGAPGRGAWIAKNSWGDDWGRNGYFYVSYYDTSCPKVGENEGVITFILNDTMKYDKVYQYDIAKTDYLFNTSSTVWYKNIFTSTGSEYLTAISTYFEKNTDYTYSVYLNGDLKQTKSGKSKAGYYTFNLHEPIPLNAGDVFEVVFKITVNGDAGIPISEKISLNNQFYSEKKSYVSYDGKKWNDLFKVSGTYPDHVYSSQVACIKAFTISNPIATTLTLAIDGSALTASVLNEWGYPVNCGMVNFRIGNWVYKVTVFEGVAKKLIDIKSQNITAVFNAVGYESSLDFIEMHSPKINTHVALNVTGGYNPVNVTAVVNDEMGNPVKYGHVIFQINDEEYKVDVVNGIAQLNDITLFSLNSSIVANYHGLYYYGSSAAVKSVQLLKKNTRIYLDILAGSENNPAEIIAHVLDENNSSVSGGHVHFFVYEDEYIVEVENGTASLTHFFTNPGPNSIIALYTDLYCYNFSQCSETLNVSTIRTNLTFDMVTNENNVFITTGIRDCLHGFRIHLYLNGKEYYYISTEGYVTIDLRNLEEGEYNYTIELLSSSYVADDLNGTFNITYQKTQIAALDASIYYNGQYSFVLNDKSGNAIADRDAYITIAGKTFKARTDSQGIARFNLGVFAGSYNPTCKFIGDDEYLKSQSTVHIDIKSTVTFVASTYTYNSRFSAKLCDSNGNPLQNKEVNVFLNGKANNVKSNSKGEISINIKLNPGTYVVKVTNPVTGEVKSQIIKVVKRITSNKAMTMYYGAGKCYKVKALDDNAKAAKGVRITFKINGKTYKRNTDSKGYASLKINQKPGKYKVTAEYKGFRVSNNVKVKSTIITKNVKVKKGKTIKFTAKLVNKKGKILKNKKVTFKFKGKTYKVKTNKKGRAVLKITKKYKKGKYVIVSKYGKLKIKNSIRIV